MHAERALTQTHATSWDTPKFGAGGHRENLPSMATGVADRYRRLIKLINVSPRRESLNELLSVRQDIDSSED
jgi:hypothetical protein